MKCSNPVRIYKGLDRREYPDGLLVACGKCLQCRLQRKAVWSLRCLHELESHENAMFVTLTYNDENLPMYADKNEVVRLKEIHKLAGRFNKMCIDGTLAKRDLQLFMKRLRKSLGDRKIRYFACGEYGMEGERPHYHLIIFGMNNLSDDDKLLVMSAWPYCNWNKNAIRKGSFGLAEKESIEYTAKYILKKYDGVKADDEYKDKSRCEPFKVGSLGIGRDYVDTHSNTLIDKGYTTVNGVKRSLPRYYKKRLSMNIDDLKEKALDREKNLVKKIIGVDISRDEAYKSLNVESIMKLEKTIEKMNMQKERNIKASLDYKQDRLSRKFRPSLQRSEAMVQRGQGARGNLPGGDAGGAGDA